MGATTKSLAGSRSVFIARPLAVAEFIAEAVHHLETIRSTEERRR
jgi:hypothetical protein